MDENEFETLETMIEHLESARIISSNKFVNYSNHGNYCKALMFKGLRERIDLEIKHIKSYIDEEREII